MDYNILGYWQRLQNLEPGDPELPGPRVLRLLLAVFEKWQSKLPWLEWDCMGHLFDCFEGEERRRVEGLSVAERRGLATREILRRLTEPELARNYGTMQIHPDEIVLGTPPPYSVGQGKELMRYLTPAEALRFQLQYFNEWSPFGHICPHHERVLQRGLADLIRECGQRRDALPADAVAQRNFYQSAIHAMEGVVEFADRYARAAERLADRQAAVAADLRLRNENRSPDDFFGREDEVFPETLARQREQGLREAAARLRKAPAQPAETFAEACQALYLVHIALHWTGDITSLGRLDQILYPYYERDLAEDRITPEKAQEILDCLWLKLDENVTLNRRHVEDRFTSSDGALLGSGQASNFDQGALTNQWMQQVTLSGYKASDEADPEDGTNPLTYMMLAASRRMPLNSPTLDLRVHAGTEDRLLEEAARTLLSGGAHPVLMNDDRLIPALHLKSGGTVQLASARNYACDGCFETHFPGQTEFSFGFVAALDVLERALNGGAALGSAGPINLKGSKGGWRTKPPGQIASWDEFWNILRSQILLGCHRFVHGILLSYGGKESVSPSPLLSALIEGCLETGRDFAAGGARYHVFAPLMTGISTAADSLHVIRHLVFERSAFSLEELVACLRSNWGRQPEVVGLQLSAERIAEIREQASSLAKFGQGREEVDRLAWQLIETFVACLHEARQDPLHEPEWRRLREKYDRPDRPFEILFTPGVGTFEQYVFGGMFAGASADGRLSGTPVASDISPAPVHSDTEPLIVEGTPVGGPEARYRHRREARLLDGLRSYGDASLDLLSDGAPADFNIREDFPPERLVEALRFFADGKGGNMMTVTVANPETFLQASRQPEDYQLVRVRMGGWTEFFSVLFPAHREQHRRRPLYTK